MSLADFPFLALLSFGSVLQDSKSEYDWWSKYYFSIGIGDKVQRGYADRETRLTVYERELESYFDKLVTLVTSLVVLFNLSVMTLVLLF